MNDTENLLRPELDDGNIGFPLTAIDNKLVPWKIQTYIGLIEFVLVYTVPDVLPVS